MSRDTLSITRAFSRALTPTIRQYATSQSRTSDISEILYSKTEDSVGVSTDSDSTTSDKLHIEEGIPKSTQSISSILSAALQRSESSQAVDPRPGGLLSSSRLGSKTKEWDTVLSGVFEPSGNSSDRVVTYSTRDRVDDSGSRVYGQDASIEALFESPMAFSSTMEEELSSGMKTNQTESHDIDAILREARKTKIAYDKSKFRQQNAYEWSKNMAGRSPRTFEDKNFFTPMELQDDKQLQGPIPFSMEYAIVTPSKQVIFRKDLMVTNSITRKNIQTVITDLVRPELYQDNIIRLQNEGWMFIGTSNRLGSSTEVNLLFERMNEGPKTNTGLRISLVAILASALSAGYFYSIPDEEKEAITVDSI